MKLIRIDDYQSWCLSVDDFRLFIDPWLTGDLNVGPGWFFRRAFNERSGSSLGATCCDALVITAPFGDHLHPPSLRLLNREIPVWTTPACLSALRRLGFQNVKVLPTDQATTVHPKLSLRAVPSGKPYDDTSIGVLASSPSSAHSIYLEPHTFDLEALASFGDSPTAVLAPLEQVTLFRKRFAMGPSVLARGLARTHAPYYIPTGSEPDKARGLIRLGLRIRGTRTELLDALRRAEVPTEVLDVRAGDALVFLTDRSAPELERAQLAP